MARILVAAARVDDAQSAYRFIRAGGEIVGSDARAYSQRRFGITNACSALNGRSSTGPELTGAPH